ncbi:MAG: archaeal proteasome endopeptidase complex subunit alpha [Candidatus Aenigmarchaeota archaeon]|nr:archaeal proteasome endopeptidase complex subunit alpha [Candidatus Aenigmarchaeota archaeon]
MQPNSNMAYDRTIVVFSPDGRLLQVEYARQAVQRGNTVVGLKTNEIIVLGATKSDAPLLENNVHKKISEIDDHVGVVSSGLLADARDIIENARVKAQIHELTYGENISVTSLMRHIAGNIHMVTQYAGVRPYGIGLLVGGVDDSPHLFETDPSGTMIEWKAQSIGKGAEKAKKILEKRYKDSMKKEDAVKLVISALKAGEKILTTDTVELAVITKNDFKQFSDEELRKLL